MIFYKKTSAILLTILFALYMESSFGINYPDNKNVIIDSDITLDEALANNNIPGEIKNGLDIVKVNYYSFDKRLHTGQVVIKKELAGDIKEIFLEIEKAHFPTEKVIPIVKYNWDDELSMEDNNTSAFNYRKIKGTSITSLHAKGEAIDINPLLNPEIRKGVISPRGAIYDPSKPGTITANSFVVKLFEKHGWNWGGLWHSLKDYQHFEKSL